MKTLKSSTCNHARATHTYVGKIRDLLARRTTLLGSATTIVYVDERKKEDNKHRNYDNPNGSFGIHVGCKLETWMNTSLLLWYIIYIIYQSAYGHPNKTAPREVNTSYLFIFAWNQHRFLCYEFLNKIS